MHVIMSPTIMDELSTFHVLDFFLDEMLNQLGLPQSLHTNILVVLGERMQLRDFGST